MLLKNKEKKPVIKTETVLVDESSGTLYFSPVSKDDEGAYTCIVSNDVGHDSSTGHLHVLGMML